MLLLFSFSVQIFSVNSEKEFRYILANSGLSFRVAPNIKSNKISVIPYGARVQILKQDKNRPFEFDNFRGYWSRIKFNGKIGYAFSGFMCSYPAPAGEKNVFEYIKRNFPNEDEDSYNYYNGIYDNGNIETNSWEELYDWSHSVIFKNAELQEIFLLCMRLDYRALKSINYFPIKNTKVGDYKIEVFYESTKIYRIHISNKPYHFTVTDGEEGIKVTEEEIDSCVGCEG